MNIKDYIASGILEMYVLGKVSPEEARRVEYYVQQFPEVANELRASQEALVSFSEVISARPREEVKKKILNKIPESTAPKSLLNGSAGALNKKRRNGPPPISFF